MASQGHGRHGLRAALNFRWCVFLLPFALFPACVAAQTTASHWNVVEAGAVADGLGDCTEVFQRLLDEAGRAGGGVVEVPAGRYRINGGLAATSGGSNFTDRTTFAPWRAYDVASGDSTFFTGTLLISDASAPQLKANGSFEAQPSGTTLSFSGPDSRGDASTFSSWRFFSVGSPAVANFTATIVPSATDGNVGMRLSLNNTGGAADDHALDTDAARIPVSYGIWYKVSFVWTPKTDTIAQANLSFRQRHRHAHPARLSRYADSGSIS